MAQLSEREFIHYVPYINVISFQSYMKNVFLHLWLPKYSPLTYVWHFVWIAIQYNHDKFPNVLTRLNYALVPRKHNLIHTSQTVNTILTCACEFVYDSTRVVNVYV